MSTGDSPNKGSNIYIWSGLSTDTKPPKAFIGEQLIETDTGLAYEWTGLEWLQRVGGIQIDPFVKSMPTTSTFHHLGHERKVFIHSDRHNGIAATGGIDDILVCIPAGSPNRQVHMRYAFNAAAQTGVLDADVILYEGTTVSAPGSSEPIICTNRSAPRTTGVLMYKAPTVTNAGDFMVQTSIFGTNKGTSSRETNVPEWVLTPDGENLRYYLFRTINNGAGLLDIVPALFFYDTEAV